MIKLLGIPTDKHSSYLRGAAAAPARIRLMEKEGSANCYTECGKAIEPGSFYNDAGDIVVAGLNDEEQFFTIKHKVADLIADRQPLLCLGGDHSIAYPVIDAFAERYPGLHVLQLDAHADLYHNFEDNPYSHASPFARIMETGKLSTLTQVGIRTLTAHQREQAASFGVNVIEMKDYTSSFLQNLQAPLYLSLDMDVLDPAFAPGVSHHEPGGMSTRQVLSLIQSLRHKLVGADIVEYNPIRDVHNITAMVAYKLMKELMTKMDP
jgi:agmatinase